VALRDLVVFVLQVSVFLTVFGFGLQTTRGDIAAPFRRPGVLARSLLAMFVIMPIVAIVLSLSFRLHPAVEIALVALALSPMPPVLPSRQVKAGGRLSYGIGLMVVAATLSIVFIPLALTITGRILGYSTTMSLLALARLAFLSALLPLILGMIAGAQAPAVTAWLERPVRILATIGLLLSAAIIIAVMLPAALTLIGNGTLFVFMAFVVVGLAVGHALGGSNHDERTVLALCTACRHPAIAIAIGRANFPEQSLVPAAVLLYLLTNVVGSLAYIAYERRALRLAGLALPR
jgi:bile acid:Na+ symporter, BASS family